VVEARVAAVGRVEEVLEDLKRFLRTGMAVVAVLASTSAPAVAVGWHVERVVERRIDEAVERLEADMVQLAQLVRANNNNFELQSLSLRVDDLARQVRELRSRPTILPPLPASPSLPLFPPFRRPVNPLDPVD
jgi:hypothetical protein